MKQFLILSIALLCLNVTGCSAMFDDQPPAPAPTPTPTPSPIVIDNDSPDLGLNAKVKKALKGHSDVARDYAAIYWAEAQVTGMENSPLNSPEDVAKNTEKLKQVFGREHNEVPEFTAIVNTQLGFIAPEDKGKISQGTLNKPFDKEYRAWFVTRLSQLSAACSRALK